MITPVQIIESPVLPGSRGFDTRWLVSRATFAGAVLGPIVGVRIGGANASLPFAVIIAAFVLVMRPPRSARIVGALAVLGALVLYGTALVLFAGGTNALGVVELLGLIAGFLAVWIIGVSLEGGRLRAFLRFARYVHVVALGLAFVEFLSGFHLPSAFITKNPGWEGPLLTLNNPNDLSTFFLFLAAMLMTETVLYRSAGQRTLALLLPLDLMIVALGGARLALLGFGAVIIMYLIFVKRLGILAGPERERATSSAGRMLALIAIASVGGIIVVASGAARTFSTIALELDTGGSTLMRWRALLESGRMAADSNFLGNGPGQFEEWMSDGRAVNYTWGLINPHNAVAEVFGQYGVFGVACLIILGALMVAGHFPRTPVGRTLRAMCIINFAALITISITASGFIETPLHWVYVGVILMISNEVRASLQANGGAGSAQSMRSVPLRPPTRMTPAMPPPARSTTNWSRSSSTSVTAPDPATGT